MRKRRPPRLFTWIIAGVIFCIVVWFMQWPFTFKSHIPLEKIDYKMACITQVKRQFNSKIISISPTDEPFPGKPLLVLAGGRGATWSGTLNIKFEDGNHRSQFFACLIDGDNPYTAKVKVIVPPR